jgi:hypothetical protein
MNGPVLRESATGLPIASKALLEPRHLTTEGVRVRIVIMWRRNGVRLACIVAGSLSHVWSSWVTKQLCHETRRVWAEHPTTSKWWKVTSHLTSFPLFPAPPPPILLFVDTLYPLILALGQG